MARAGAEQAAAPREDVSQVVEHLFHAVLGEFELRLKNHRAAAGHFRRALRLTKLESEQHFLAKRAASCESQIDA